jgi:hypothetical protein
MGSLPSMRDGQRHEPDSWPRYCVIGLTLRHSAAGPSGQRVSDADTLYMDGHRGPVPWSLQPGHGNRPTAARLGTGLGRPKPTYAGPNNPDSYIHLDLLRPAAICSEQAGARRMTRTNPGWSGSKAVATTSRTGPGRNDQDAPLGEITLFIAIPHVTVGMPHRLASTFYREVLLVLASLL